MLRKRVGMELHQIAQHADDLSRAVAFYQDILGGELIVCYDPPGLAFLRLGQARLLLDRAAPSALIYLRVEDARESARHLHGKRVRQGSGKGSMMPSRACGQGQSRSAGSSPIVRMSRSRSRPTFSANAR